MKRATLLLSARPWSQEKVYAVRSAGPCMIVPICMYVCMYVCFSQQYRPYYSGNRHYLERYMYTALMNPICAKRFHRHYTYTARNWHYSTGTIEGPVLPLYLDLVPCRSRTACWRTSSRRRNTPGTSSSRARCTIRHTTTTLQQQQRRTAKC